MLRSRTDRYSSGRNNGGGAAGASTASQRSGRRAVRGLKRHPVLYAILGAMVLLFISGMATGFDLAVRLNYILLFLIIVSWVWARAAASQVTAEVKRPQGTFSVGDRVTETITLHNRGRTPKAWMEVEDKTSLPNVSFRHVTGLGIMVPFSKLEASETLRKRGDFAIGPLVVRVSDPFALFPQEIEFAGEDRILVYPRVLELPDFAAPNPYLVGDHTRRHRANIVTTDVASVREYASGDSMSRIHWLSTARTGRLMVKQFDQGSSSHLWVVFDQHRDAQAGEGEESTDEYGATVAASVVDRYTRGFLPVGYAAHGSEPIVMPPDRTMGHRETIMRHIASSLPVGETPLMAMLSDLERDFSQSTSLVVITAAGKGDWIDALGGLQRRGVKVSVVLLDTRSFDGEDNSSALEDLVLAGVRTYRVHRGHSIPSALASPVGPEAFGWRPSTDRQQQRNNGGASVEEVVS